MARKMMVATLIIASFAATNSPLTARADPPRGYVARQWIRSEDHRRIYGIGFNSAFIDLDWEHSGTFNPSGAYYKTLVREGWIYQMKWYNISTRRWNYYWVYNWDSAGQMTPYDTVRTYYGIGDRITDDFGQQ